MWEDYDLPSYAVIEGKKIDINTGWTNIVDIIRVYNNDELLPIEKADCVLRKFYQNVDDIRDFETAIDCMSLFVAGNRDDTYSGEPTKRVEPRLVDWEKDLRIIIPPVNKVLGYDVREHKDLHWWTFLGAFNEIGECTFQTYVGIRSKIANRKKLEDYEKEIYTKHKNEIDIGRKTENYEDNDDDDILVQLSRKNAEYLIDR